MKSQKIAFIEALRAVAALSVLVCHFFYIYWYSRISAPIYANTSELTFEAYPTPSYVPWIAESPLFHYGAFGVGLFFIVSGFVIPLALTKYSAKQFLVGRFFRLYPTYWAGLTIGMIAVVVSGYLYGRPFPHSASEVFWQYLIGTRDLVNSKNLDGVLWTLEIEVRFYLLCAVAICLFRLPTKHILLVPAALAVMCCALIPIISPTLSTPPGTIVRLLNIAFFDGRFLIFMFIGVVLSRHHTGLLSTKWALGAAVVLYILFTGFVLIAWHAGDLRQPPTQIWGYSLAFVTFLSIYFIPWQKKNYINPALKFFADISYPLYIVHTIAGFLTLRLLNDAGVSSVPAFLIATATVTALALALHVLVERPTHRFGRTFN